MQNIKSLLEDSSIPGVQNIIKTSYFTIRILWFISLTILFLWCAIFLSDIIKSYIDYDIVTNIDLKREERSQFPTITFCISTNDSKTLRLDDILKLCAFDLTAYNSTSFEVYNIGLNETNFSLLFYFLINFSVHF